MDGLYINRYKQPFLSFCVAFQVFFMIVIVMYANCIARFRPSTTWLYQISVKCPVSEQLSELIFHDAVFAEYGMIFYIFGCYMGLLQDAK